MGELSRDACLADANEIQRALLQCERRVLHKSGLRYASVLTALLREGNRWLVLLTRRDEDLPHHQGQIAFPGGSLDEGESAEQAALREAKEEIGLDPSDVRILGCHDDIWTPTGFIITPVIALLTERPRLTINPAEVARVFYAPLCYFSDERHVERRTLIYDGVEREVLFHDYDGEVIWGATALIISNLLTLLQGGMSEATLRRLPDQS